MIGRGHVSVSSGGGTPPLTPRTRPCVAYGGPSDGPPPASCLWWVLLVLPLLFSCKQEPAPSPSSPAAEPKRAPPGPTAPEAPTPGVAQHQFYGVYIKGQKAGWAESKRLDLSDPAKGPSVRFQVKAEFRIARLGQVLHTGIEDVVEFDRDDAGRLRSCRIVHHIGGEKAVTHCKRVGDD